MSKKRGGIQTHGHWILLSLILALALYIIYLSRAFILPLISAAIFSYVSYPLYKYMVKKTKKKKMSAFYSVSILTIVVLVPIILAIFLLALQTINFVNTAPSGFISNSIERVGTFSKDVIGLNLVGSNSTSVLETSSAKIRGVMLSSSIWVLNGISRFIFQVIFILIFMFYFYIYGPAIFHKFDSVLPFSKTSKIIFHNQIQKDVKALFLGQGLVALIQGILGGIGFFIAGLPNVFLWSFVMILTSFLPIVGAWLVWFPAVVYLLLSGSILQGFFLLIWGIIVVSNIDNLLRPFIVNTMSKLDFLVVLVGVLIGIKAFNLIGIIVGPLLISTLITFIKIYYEESVSDFEKKKIHKKIKKITV